MSRERVESERREKRLYAQAQVPVEKKGKKSRKKEEEKHNREI
jgi:hypothetical protein